MTKTKIKSTFKNLHGVKLLAAGAFVCAFLFNLSFHNEMGSRTTSVSLAELGITQASAAENWWQCPLTGVPCSAPGQTQRCKVSGSIGYPSGVTIGCAE